MIKTYSNRNMFVIALIARVSETPCPQGLLLSMKARDLAAGNPKAVIISEAEQNKSKAI